MARIDTSSHNQTTRGSGISVIGNVSWGTHFCQFYESKHDLIEILVPYFKAGLENNEFCMWVTSQPLTVEEAKEAFKNAIPDADTYLKKGQIEIISYTDWYMKDGFFDSERILDGWMNKLNFALNKGYDGMRITGSTFWLEKEDWDDFNQYESEIDRVLGNYNIISVCSYSLDKCNADDVIEVVNNHQLAITELGGEWTLM